MSKIIVVKDETGHLAGLGEKNERAYNRFKRQVTSMEVGETLAFGWKKPRSPKFHRLHFGLLHAAFDAQEQFQLFDPFRMWVQVGAGHCDLLPGPHGKPVAVPRSIAWEEMDDNEFYEHHIAAVAFLRSVHAYRYLWPHLPNADAESCVNVILEQFEI